jgi:hypothetical protein
MMTLVIASVAIRAVLFQFFIIQLSPKVIFNGLHFKSRLSLDHEASVMVQLRFGDEYRRYGI